MAGFHKLFNPLVYVGPRYLLSETGFCVCHSLVTLVCKYDSMLPEVFWYDNTVTAEEKLAQSPEVTTRCTLLLGRFQMLAQLAAV